MASLLSYSIFSGIILLILYITYKFLCSGERQHTFNRILILLIYIVSFGAYPVYQLINTESSNTLSSSITIAVPSGVIDNIISSTNVTAQHTPHIIFNILLWIYLIGMCATLIHTFWIALKIYRIIHSGRHIAHGKYTLIITENNALSPFSWYKYIVMNEKDYTDSANIIIVHETEHLNCRHWIDMIIAQIAIVIEWYNPASWLMLEELKSLHEYQADERVLYSDINPKDYQLLLIKKAVGERFPSLTNSLNQSKLKKRITMMYNQKSSFKRRFRSLALVPALAFALGVINMPAVASTIAKAAEASLSSSDSKVSKKSATDDNKASVVMVSTIKKGHEKTVGDILSAHPSSDTGSVTIVSNDTVIYMQHAVSGGIKAEEILEVIPNANSISVSNNNASDNVSVVKVGTIKKGHEQKIGNVFKVQPSAASADVTIISNDTVIYMQRPASGKVKAEEILNAIPNVNSISISNDTIYVK